MAIDQAIFHQPKQHLPISSQPQNMEKKSTETVKSSTPPANSGIKKPEVPPETQKKKQSKKTKKKKNKNQNPASSIDPIKSFTGISPSFIAVLEDDLVEELLDEVVDCEFSLISEMIWREKISEDQEENKTGKLKERKQRREWRIQEAERLADLVLSETIQSQLQLIIKEIKTEARVSIVPLIERFYVRCNYY